MAFTFGQRPTTLPELGWARRKGVVRFSTTITIGAAGAISTQDKSELTGMNQVVKTAATTGRYTFQLPCMFKAALGGNVMIIGPDTANYGANTTGLVNFWRRCDFCANMGSTAKDGTIELQFIQTSYADAEVPSGVILVVELYGETGV